MKAFLTGIAGFAGSYLAERLLDDGTEVSGLVIDADETQNLADFSGQIRIEEGDVRDQEKLTTILKDIRPDVIYHLAAFASVHGASSAPEEAFSVNFLGTWSLCRAAIDSGIDPEVLIVTSGEVYGEQQGPIPETAPLRPANAYAVSKAAADFLASQIFLEHGMRTIRFRPFNHTGPRQAPSFVCSDFARQIAWIEAGRAPPVLSVGNLDAVRDFLPVDDVVEAYRLAPGRLTAGEAYNVASGRGRSIRELLDILLGLTDVDIEVRPQTSRLRTGDIKAMIGDSSRLRKATGWEATHPPEGALSELLEYWRSTASDEK